MKMRSLSIIALIASTVLRFDCNIHKSQEREMEAPGFCFKESIPFAPGAVPPDAGSTLTDYR